MSVTVTRKRILADRLGNGDGGGGRLRRFARRVRIVLLCVSRANVVRMKAKIAKKINVHCVQRQPLRTVTKAPITGLFGLISH